MVLAELPLLVLLGPQPAQHVGEVGDGGIDEGLEVHHQALLKEVAEREGVGGQGRRLSL